MPRVIAGKARGTQLKTLSGEKTRPTADRTKEAVFSSLGNLVTEARVLDLCAGSGQLGIEALSRGAKSAVFVDQAAPACAVIRENLQRTHLEAQGEVICRELIRTVKQLLQDQQEFDLVFFDPPYAKAGELLAPLARSLAEGLLAAEGVLIMEESSREFTLPQNLPLTCRKRSRYGAAMISYYVRPEESSVLE